MCARTHTLKKSAGPRAAATRPRVTDNAALVELPQLYMEVQDASGLTLTHAECDGV